MLELIELCKKNKIDLYKKIDNTITNSKKVRKNKPDLIMSLIEFEQNNKIANGDLNNQKKEREYKLLNILTEEIIEVKYNENYGDIIDFLLNENINKKDSDFDFINKCLITNISVKITNDNTQNDTQIENQIDNQINDYDDNEEYMFK